MSETKEQDITNKEPPQTSNGQQEKQPLSRKKLIDRWFEVVTAIMLGVVAVATAWSGYQATRWSGQQAAHYSEANAQRVASIRDSTLASQYMLYDVQIFNQWLNADFHGETN